ncbi:MAG: preprotein translocase subunit SecA [Legionellales bacterium]|nr:preprotein translocase subunit SecA [Legionellales bacterium]
MFATLAKKIFGSRNERLLTRLYKAVDQINALESTWQALDNTQLQQKTIELRNRYQQGESLDRLLPEAFATVREASVRTLRLRHYDVQLIGGMILHQGKISEMRTGEGKTLGATLPVYLNALTGEGVHVITVNDYLAQRDAQWMKPIYDFLGLTVGVVLADMPFAEKQQAYLADVTYGTNNEFGFDYLRDNMAFSLEQKVQRGLHFAIVDEVDSILIDEARTPLIISGAIQGSSDLYQAIDRIIPQLIRQQTEEGPGDFSVDEKQRQVYLTEEGQQRIEELLTQAELLPEGESLYQANQLNLMHHVNAALKAHALFQKDVDYIVKDNEVIIVDEHTGRTMQGRRWAEGLHQAVEAKERVKIHQENQTLASITFQNYFRLYAKLSGMTGTADTEAYEFQQIYGLEVVVIPTNQPMIRDDQADLVYLTTQDKFQAIIEDIKACRTRMQPVLVGTASIEASELVSRLLRQEKIQHQVLNAKFHAKEAEIITEAGRPGAVTIATNMAGRGTDIVLGGNLASELKEMTDAKVREGVEQEWKQRHAQVLEAGGLRIIGSERHESRRIDNQLRGRAGRQGDPGSSRFYLSLEDNLMRIFASERVGTIMKKLGMKPGEAIEHSWINRAIENAQRKVEGRNFDIRKQLLDFDDVANDQRQVVYSQRASIMDAQDIDSLIAGMREEVIVQFLHQFIPPQSMPEQWDVAGLTQQLVNNFGVTLPIQDWLDEEATLSDEDIEQRVQTAVAQRIEAKQQQLGEDVLVQLEQSLLLQALDNHWREHLAAMDFLRQGIHLRGYAQKDPKQEYKREAFALFTEMLAQWQLSVIATLSQMEIQTEEEAVQVEAQRRAQASVDHLQLQHPSAGVMDKAQSGSEPVAGHGGGQTFVREQPKVGRNQPCPCGSGKKYKHCHGQLI